MAKRAEAFAWEMDFRLRRPDTQRFRIGYNASATTTPTTTTCSRARRGRGFF
jgi:hypothetical protein